MKSAKAIMLGFCCVAGAAQAAQPLPPVVEGGKGEVVRANQSNPSVRVSSQTILEMYRQLEQLKQEVRQLRGEIEELNHNMEGVKKRQRDIYLDLDRRIQPLESSSAEGARIKPEQQPAEIPVIPDAEKAINTGRDLPAPTAIIPQASRDPVAERKAYQQAFNSLKEGHYSQSIERFKEFLSTYPTGEYADNATYWLAEAYYVTRAFSEAQATFGNVLTSFPESTKVPDAMLKTGYIAYELKSWKEARKKLTEVVNRFPNSSAARLAEKRLLRMKQEKH